MNLEDPIDVVARTVWAEARGYGREGMAAVAAVIMNRANHPRWWGATPITVCLERWQFSCWNGHDPNLPLLRVVTVADPDFADAIDIATAAVAGHVVDPTGNADSYYDTTMMSPPGWAATAKPTVTIRGHQFFCVELEPTIVAPMPSVVTAVVPDVIPDVPAPEPPAEPAPEPVEWDHLNAVVAEKVEEVDAADLA